MAGLVAICPGGGIDDPGCGMCSRGDSRTGGGVRFYPLLSPDVEHWVKMKGIIARTGNPDVHIEIPMISYINLYDYSFLYLYRFYY